MSRTEIIDHLTSLQAYRSKLNARWKELLDNETTRLNAILTTMDTLFGTEWTITKLTHEPVL